MTTTDDRAREKRRLILRAAITVFARKGYHASKVSEIATEAGVAYGLVYHYFGSKEALLETIFRRTWRRMLEAVEAIEAAGGTAQEQIAGVAEIVLGAWEADPELIGVLVREVARGPQLQHEVDEIGHAFAALERIVARGQERGELDRALEPRLAAWVLYGALEEILTGWTFEQLPSSSEHVTHAKSAVVRILARGMAAD